LNQKIIEKIPGANCIQERESSMVFEVSLKENLLDNDGWEYISNVDEIHKELDYPTIR
jgi:hypothetical protein